MLNNYIEFKYWFLKQFEGGGDKKYWSTLSHNGVLFPPEYKKVDVPIIYKGEEIILNKSAEEAAFFYAKYINSEYVKMPRFNRNFWKDFKKLIKPEHNIENLEEIDFSKMTQYLEKIRLDKLNKTKEEKENEKNDTLLSEEKYTKAFIDGKEQQVGNFRIEPPGIFIGRGCHPKIGKIKKRIYPEDITINIGRGEKIPDTGFEGREWNEVIHDTTVLWLAAWKDNITDKMKYVRLGDKSDFKSESDMNKFELARKLKKKFGEIKKFNEINLVNDNIKIKQLATALYFIENFSIRVGNEKSKDEADTVGASSLRVEHINLLDNNVIKLDFLGKDSVRYVKKIPVSDIVYNNLKDFTNQKNKKDQLFDKISPSDLNNYLQQFMKNLTSKVFRTMNASRLFQKELNKISSKFQDYDKDDKINLILDEYNKANAKVALLCNHQKNINKNFNNSIDKILNKIKILKKKKKELENKKIQYKLKNKNTKSIKEKINKVDLNIKKLKSTKTLKIEMKNVSLGTSKINYIDPRITLSFIKKHNIDINKLFTPTLQEKFRWASNVDENFSF